MYSIYIYLYEDVTCTVPKNNHVFVYRFTAGDTYKHMHSIHALIRVVVVSKSIVGCGASRPKPPPRQWGPSEQSTGKAFSAQHFCTTVCHISCSRYVGSRAIVRVDIEFVAGGMCRALLESSCRICVLLVTRHIEPCSLCIGTQVYIICRKAWCSQLVSSGNFKSSGNILSCL